MFLSSIATVMGPTPPGTGVMYPATFFTSVKTITLKSKIKQRLFKSGAGLYDFGLRLHLRAFDEGNISPV